MKITMKDLKSMNKIKTEKQVLNYQSGLCEYVNITTFQCGHNTRTVTFKPIPKPNVSSNCPRCRLETLMCEA